MPSAETLIKMADYLNTSTDYLLDLTDNVLPIRSIKTNEFDELLAIYNKLDIEGKNDLVKYAKIRELMK